MYDDIKHFCSHFVSHAARHFIYRHILLITTTKLNNLMFQKERYVGIETITTGGVSFNIFHEYEQIWVQMLSFDELRVFNCTLLTSLLQRNPFRV